MPHVDPVARRRNAKERNDAKYRFILAARNKPCVDCGVELPAEIMELDHVRGSKHRPVSEMRACSYETIQAEIDKCEVRCPNCHAMRHYLTLPKVP